MYLELKVDGETVATMTLNTEFLEQYLQKPLTINHAPPSRSTPMTEAEIKDLLSRIDVKSVDFLKRIAASDGSITWGEMRQIFGIKDVKDWPAFSSGHGKGITRALRHVKGDKSARLVWWDDDEWEEDPSQWDPCEVHVDGSALQALRAVAGVGA